MTWCVVFIPWLLQSALATFPPVSNAPPIPNQAVRTLDISGQRFYVQDDLQINPPQTGIIKEESYPPPLPPDPKLDDQRWFVYENQSGETSDFPSSTETFDRYYSNGLPAVGPVATPVPDDTYVAQPSGTSKVIPENPANVGSSDIWVLAKGPDDQYVPQRWVQVQMPQERISQVVNPDYLPRIVPGSVKSLAPQPLQPVKTSGPPVAPSDIQQQVWFKVTPAVESQKVDIQQQPIKQYIQMDVVQDPQVPNVVTSKSSNFVLPPPPPPTFKGGVINQPQQTVQVSPPVVYKGSDISSPKQTVVVNQPANYKGVDTTSLNQPMLVDQPITYKGGDIVSQNQPVNYKGVDINSPKQAVLINQPANYKGVDINSPSQAVLVNNQAVNYKGVDINSPSQAVLVNNQAVNYKGVDIDTPNQSVLVNQPGNYKGVDITPQNQAVIVNQPGNYKGVDITPQNQAVIVNQPGNYKGVDITPQSQAVVVNQPPTYKGVDVPSTNQAVFLNQQTNYKGGDITSPKQVAVVTQSQINVPVAGNVLTQVKHIWIPTSQRTGKFITVPVRTVVDPGKSIPQRGIQVQPAAQPFSVSGTWVLKQDGRLPRFEPQRTISTQMVQKGTPLVAGTVLQFDSPKNPSLFGKSDAKVPVDIWANSKDFSNANFVAKSVVSSPPLPIPNGKAGSVVVGKSGPVFNISPQKTFISNDKGVPLQPLPVPVAPPVLQGTKGKPCLIGPQKLPISPKVVPYPVYRSAVTINRQSFPRILRLNRFPYGSYYVLNPKVGQRMYSYPRPQVPVIQQTKNGIMRIIPSKQVGVPQRQLYIAVPRKQIALPAPQIRSISPVVQSQLAYPSIQAVNRIRYAYPRGSYLRTLPVAGKNVFIFPPGKKTKSRKETLQSSSSESSSSESSSSESQSAEIKPESIEETGEAQSEASPESAEPKSERETEDVEAAASEPEPESKEASEAEEEGTESKSAESEASDENKETVDSEENSAS